MLEKAVPITTTTSAITIELKIVLQCMFLDSTIITLLGTSISEGP